VAALALALAGCATPSPRVSRPAPEAPAPRAPAPDAPPREAPPSKSRPSTVQTGTASWYGKAHHGRLTASGEPYDMYALTAAHLSWPLGTRVLVTNLKNGRSVVVRINDRGPIVPGRIIDLSYAAAERLGAVSDGTVRVQLRVLSTPDSGPKTGAAPPGRASSREGSAADAAPELTARER